MCADLPRLHGQRGSGRPGEGGESAAESLIALAEQVPDPHGYVGPGPWDSAGRVMGHDISGPARGPIDRTP